MSQGNGPVIVVGPASGTAGCGSEEGAQPSAGRPHSVSYRETAIKSRQHHSSEVAACSVAPRPES